MPAAFDYANVTGRATGPVVALLSALLPGVRRVQDQAAPYARAWQEANRAALAAAGSPRVTPLWVALGDSLTQGVGASAYDRGFVGQLSTRLQDEWPHRLVNLGAHGARIDDVVEQQVPTVVALAEEGQVATVVTCVAGSNDLVSRRHRAALVERYEHLLTVLPVGTVVANLPNPSGAARRLDDLLHARAAAGDIRLADLRGEGPRGWRGMLADDRFHPNDRGYAALADVLEGPIRRAAGLPDRT